MYKNPSSFLEAVLTENLYNLDKQSTSLLEGGLSLIIVSHILPDKFDFIKILSKYFKVEFIVPKPKSIDQNTLEKIKKEFEILNMTRDDIFHNQDFIIDKIASIKNSVIIIDIGGYFAKILKTLDERLEGKIIGVIEDTENGFQKYEKVVHDVSIPIISVARSALKEGEDYLVGQSVVFSTDYVLRLNNILLHNKYAGIIGFGKIGRSIAFDLKGKNVQLGINDINPYKGVEILTYGYNFLSKIELFKKSDIIFLATGNFGLQGNDFEELKDGVILASVTSSDDELDIHYLKEHYDAEIINKYTTKYTKNGKDIYLLYGGNAINFINNAVVGDFIYLVQAEIIHGIFELIVISKLSTQKVNNKLIKYIDNNKKKYIPTLRLEYFNN